MTPTQAQIEAAAMAFMNAGRELGNPSPSTVTVGQLNIMLTAALTAAAEVGDMGNYDSDTIKNWKWHCLSCGTLTNDGECDCTKWPEYANRQRLLRLHP